MKMIMSMLTVAVLPAVVLVVCQSGRGTQSASGGAPPAERYSSADQERAVLKEMNLNRPGPIGQKSASARDTEAMRESMANKPIRERQTQSSTSTTNEMAGGKALPRASGQGMSEQSESMAMERQPSVIEERTVVIVPVEPREEATIEPRNRSSEEVGLRQGAESSMPGSNVDVAEIAPYEPDFRQNYEANYANSGYGYDQYRPAYQYGFGLAKDPRYTTMDWNDVEMRAHRNWNEGTMGPWDRYKDAVHYGWERGREVAPGRG
jgi:hypothetical protein